MASQHEHLFRYLSPNFEANVGNPPKQNSESRLQTYVETNKYQRTKTPRDNKKLLIRRLSNPHAEQVLNCPTYLDFMHSHDEGSNTCFTDNFYETLNDFEAWAIDKIKSSVYDIFRTDTDNPLTDSQKDTLVDKVLAIFRNSFAGPIDANNLVDQQRATTMAGTQPFQSTMPKPGTYQLSVDSFDGVFWIVDLNPDPRRVQTWTIHCSGTY